MLVIATCNEIRKVMSVIKGRSSLPGKERSHRVINPGCTMGDAEAQTLVGVQRSVLFLLDESGRCHGKISRIVRVWISFCALQA